MDRKLAEHFVDHAVVTRQEMQRCILRASMEKTSVIGELVGLSHVDENEVARHLASYYGYELLEGASIHAQPYALKLLSKELAEANEILPIQIDAVTDVVTLAVSDPLASKEIIASIEASMGKAPTISIVARSKLLREIYRHYRPKDNDATPSAIVERGLNMPTPALPPGAGGSAAGKKKDHHQTRQIELDDDDDELLNPAKQTINGTSADPISLDDFDLGLKAPDPVDYGEPVDFGFGPGGPPKAKVTTPAPKPSALDGGRSPIPGAGAVSRAGLSQVGRRGVNASQSSMESVGSGLFALEESSPGKAKAKPSRSAAGTPKPTTAKPRESNDIAGALNQFDAFLDEHKGDESGFGLAGPNWNTPARRPGFASPPGFSVEDSDASSLHSSQGGGEDAFDLFEEPEAPERQVEMTLHELVAQNQRTIGRLEREIEHQRNVLQTLSDLLIEARVLSRKQLKDRLLALRKK